MPECKQCGDDVDELVTVTIGGKKKKLCEECADEHSHDEQIAQESEAAVQQMMGFTGRR
jgi:protein-arginine kinase activator protein McsA